MWEKTQGAQPTLSGTQLRAAQDGRPGVAGSPQEVGIHPGVKQ